MEDEVIICKTPPALTYEQEELMHHYRDRIRAVLAEMAAKDLYMKEEVYGDFLLHLSADVFDFEFDRALELAGRKPFDPWAVPYKDDAPEEQTGISGKPLSQAAVDMIDVARGLSLLQKC